MRGYYLDGSVEDIQKNPEIIPVESITPEKESIRLEPGQAEQVSISVEPEENNDVVLWKSEDETVATVFEGKIQAKADGNTRIIAYSQSGEAESEILLKVGSGYSPEKSDQTALMVIAGTVVVLAVVLLVSNSRKKSRN